MRRIKLTPANPVETELELWVAPQAIMVVAEAEVQVVVDGNTTEETRIITQIILVSGQVLNVIETPKEIKALELKCEKQ